MSSALDGLSEAQAALVREHADALARVSGVAALVLGGSFARGRPRTDSDIDLGILYSDAQPLDLAALRALARRFDDTPDPTVSELYEWGPWVNGGAWLRVGGQRVDWLFRNLEQLERVIADAEAGRFEDHYAQQPPYGFQSVMYLGDLASCRVLHDPGGRIAALRRRVASHPEPLRRALLERRLAGVEFNLRAFARPAAQRGDVYYTVGCLTRGVAYLVQALFALNRCYLVNEKTALAEIADFALCPDRFSERVRALLGAPGHDAARLVESVDELESLYRETAALVDLPR